MSFEFALPWAFLLALPLSALLAWRLWRRRAASSLGWPALARVPQSWRVKALLLPKVLFALGIAALLVALARPREGLTRTHANKEGISISMVLDRSASMDEPLDAQDPSSPTKLEVVKGIFARFVQGDAELPGRQGDLVGLLGFARYPDEVCPPTTQPEALIKRMNALETVPPFLDARRVPTRDRERAVEANPLSATAIGDALNRGVLSLSAAAEGRSTESANKALILLTDGENNAGVDPREAARFAEENGVRVYTILFCGRTQQVVTPFGEELAVPLTLEDLEARLAVPKLIANETGGAAFVASDEDSLAQVYEQIDALERVDLGAVETTTYRERYTQPLFAGFGLLLLSAALDLTLLRRLI